MKYMALIVILNASCASAPVHGKIFTLFYSPIHSSPETGNIYTLHEDGTAVAEEKP